MRINEFLFVGDHIHCLNFQLILKLKILAPEWLRFGLIFKWCVYKSGAEGLLPGEEAKGFNLLVDLSCQGRKNCGQGACRHLPLFPAAGQSKNETHVGSSYTIT